MVGIGKHVKVWQETINGGLQMVGEGVIEVMGMGSLVVKDGLSHVQKFNLKHIILEEDNEGYKTLQSGVCPKPAGAKGVKVYHKQKARFHRGGGYRIERYLVVS